MGAAIRLSRRNEGLTAENPSVGALIVRDGAIVGRGVTAPGGRPHAERIALAEASERARGATAYVTLEPCAHTGRTPPCADALVEAGVARVVVGANDSDERVAGRGVAGLREAGIEVVTGVLAGEARDAMAGFLSRVERARPHVLLKLAVSADGFLGRSGAGQVAITGAEARRQVQVMRARSDAILVGSGTVREDDPSLAVRLPGLERRSPLRVVLASELDVPRTAAIVRTSHEVPSLLVASSDEGDAHDRWRNLSQVAPALERVVLQGDPADRLSNLLAALAARGIGTLMVEGGAAVARSFLDAGLVDEIALFTGAHIGGDVVSPLAPDEVPSGFTVRRRETHGGDRLLVMTRIDTCSPE